MYRGFKQVGGCVVCSFVRYVLRRVVPLFALVCCTTDTAGTGFRENVQVSSWVINEYIKKKKKA